MHSANIKKQAVQLHRQGQLAEAKKHYTDYLEEHPNDADVSHAYGVLLAQLGEYQEALTAIQHAITGKANQATYYSSLGNVHAALGNTKQAILAYQTAIKKQPAYASAYNNLARLYVKQDKLIAAKKAYLKALEANPNHADALCNLGILYVQLDNEQEAKKYLQRSIQSNPNQRIAKRQLADIYLREGQFNASAEQLLDCVLAEKNNINDFNQLAIAYYYANEPEKAEAAFEQVLILDQTYPEANHNLANTLLALGEYDKAITYYLRQLTNAPLQETYYNLGCLFLAKDRLEEAKQYLFEVQKKAPNDLATQLNLGNIYLKQQNIKSATLHYTRALEINPKDPEIAHILAALNQNKLPDKAPPEYLSHLFDQYAVYYDKHLVTCLSYQVPQKIYDMLAEELELTTDLNLRLLDLGCGTGLIGEKLSRYTSKLIGVDVSKKMLEIANNKGIYQELLHLDIENIDLTDNSMDCVIAADVFTYIGKLENIFKRINQILQPGGTFIFSVEKTHECDFKLQHSIRYAHSKSYLSGLVSTFQFKQIRFDNIILRKQQNHPVEGYLVMLKKEGN